MLITYKKGDVCLDDQRKIYLLLKYDLAIKSLFKLIKNLSECLKKCTFTELNA